MWVKFQIPIPFSLFDYLRKISKWVKIGKIWNFWKLQNFKKPFESNYALIIKKYYFENLELFQFFYEVLFMYVMKWNKITLLSYISKIVCENFEVFVIWFYEDSLMFDNLTLKWCKFFLIDRISGLENYVMFRHQVCLFSRKLFDFVVWNIGWYIFLWKKWGFVTFSWFYESTSFCYTEVNFYQITIIIPSKFQVFSKFLNL